MLAATAWDEGDWQGEAAGGWTVMGQLRQRQLLLRAQAEAAQKRLAQSAGTMRMMTAAAGIADYEDGLRARWKGGPSVLAFLFAQPDTEPIRALDSSGEYFDLRSGSTWDLFFPGYYRSEECNPERPPESEPAGMRFADDWFFSPHGFDLLRRHVEDASAGRWQYSGLADLVLVCAWIGKQGEPTVDWASTVSGSIAGVGGTQTLTLGEVIERISQDLESGEEDADFGVGEVTSPSGPGGGAGIGRDFMVGVLGGIAVALGEAALS